MDAEEARQVGARLRRLGLPPVVAPVDPDGPTGPRGGYDCVDPLVRDRIKADAPASELMKPAEGVHASRRGAGSGATRGFVMPGG
ncbi:hypothetical protein GCM10022284_44680 [Streptomyces hundungensis]